MISSFCCPHLQVNTVGISAPNMMKSIEKKRNPVLLKTLLASLPMLRYSNPIKTPMATWKISLRWVKSWEQITNKGNSCIVVLIVTYAVAIFQQLSWTNITHLVSADSYEGSFEEDTELGKCTRRKRMAFCMSSTLTDIKVDGYVNTD